MKVKIMVAREWSWKLAPLEPLPPPPLSQSPQLQPLPPLQLLLLPGWKRTKLSQSITTMRNDSYVDHVKKRLCIYETSDSTFGTFAFTCCRLAVSRKEVRVAFAPLQWYGSSFSRLCADYHIIRPAWCMFFGIGYIFVRNIKLVKLGTRNEIATKKTGNSNFTI